LALLWSLVGKSSWERLGFLLLVIAVWLGPNELWKAGGVDLARDWPDFQDLPPATKVIVRPLFVPLFLSVHFYALLATFIWLVVRSHQALAGGEIRSKPALAKSSGSAATPGPT